MEIYGSIPFELFDITCTIIHLLELEESNLSEELDELKELDTSESDCKGSKSESFKLKGNASIEIN